MALMEIQLKICGFHGSFSQKDSRPLCWMHGEAKLMLKQSLMWYHRFWYF